MARPREFDEDEVLDRALEVFWAQGYEATSLTDLMAATGLAKGSVYKGFGDKKSLFLKTLERYFVRGRSAYRALDQEAKAPREVLREWMTSVLASATTCDAQRGCFGVNCIVELAPHHADVRALATEHRALLRSLYAATIRRGQETGEFATRLDPEEAATWLDTVLSGLQVNVKTGTSSFDASPVISFALDALG